MLSDDSLALHGHHSQLPGQGHSLITAVPAYVYSTSMLSDGLLIAERGTVGSERRSVNEIFGRYLYLCYNAVLSCSRVCTISYQ